MSITIETTPAGKLWKAVLVLDGEPVASAVQGTENKAVQAVAVWLKGFMDFAVAKEEEL